MNTNDNGRAEARSRANRRLRNLTIGTAMLGVAATGTLGWMAAATYDGATAADATTAAVTTSNAVADTGPITTTTTTATTSSSVPTVSNASGNAHASTGGS